MTVQFRDALTPGDIDVLGQLFLCGPTWDGNLVSKQGRDTLVRLGLAGRVDGWNYLTRDGVDLAATAYVKDRRDKRWYDKQSCK